MNEKKFVIGGHTLDETAFKRIMQNKERIPDPMRYKKEAMHYRRAGASGLKLPEVSLGLWHNFGSMDNYEFMRDMIFTAFDNGVCHFDLANNYGPRNGAAEENFGRILRESFPSYRDEMCISTKAGFGMWKGPYGDGGSKKYLTASLDQSLKRLGLDYVDIFYHHRPDPNTPIEETCYALHRLVEQGKALYIGISNYDLARTKAAVDVFRELRTPFILHQTCYNLLDRTERAQRVCRRAGLRHHCLLAARAGAAHGQVSLRHPRRQPHAQELYPQRGTADARPSPKIAKAARSRRRTRADARGNGALVGAQR